MDIRTSHCPFAPSDSRWSAVDDATYDGAPDSSNRNQIGYGPTERAARLDLLRLNAERALERSVAERALLKGAFEAMRDLLGGLRVFDDGYLVEFWRNDQCILARPARSAEGLALRALERDRSSALAKVARYFEEACGHG